jgi:hypothetical protein
MATSPLTLVLITAASSIAGALLAIFLTPWLQHHFWTYQKRAELRLAAINEFNRLASKFITGYMAAEAAKPTYKPELHMPQPYKPDLEWFEAFASLSGTIRTLFSPAGVDAFKAVEVLIGPSKGGGLGAEGKKTVHDFIEARDAALRALYAEVIALPAPPVQE